MKTTIYSMLLMLTFAGGLIMKGQNQGTISPPAENNANSQESGKKILIALNAKNFSTNETPKSAKTNLPETTEEANPARVDKLLQQAEDINVMANALRKEAKSAQPEKKSVLLEEAKNLDYIAMTKQVEAGEITGKINLQKYHTNRNVINNMIERHEGKTILNHTRFLITESEKNMKIARDLRQEASAQKNLPSKLGSMSNAEEKELLALGNQTEAIGLLKKSLN